jgi:hypothetical protein
MARQYALRLNPKHPRAWQFQVSWRGWYSGLGYVDKPKDALKFSSIKQARAAMAGTFVGLNGLMDIYRLR